MDFLAYRSSYSHTLKSSVRAAGPYMLPVSFNASQITASGLNIGTFCVLFDKSNDLWFQEFQPVSVQLYAARDHGPCAGFFCHSSFLVECLCRNDSVC